MATEQWTLRVEPTLDKKVRQEARRADMSLNAYVVSVLQEQIDRVKS